MPNAAALVVVQARRRGQSRPVMGLGFTATKKVGGSVVRNRARRRLREAALQLLPGLGVAGVDYVLVARQETGMAAWPRLLDDLEKALISLRRRFISGDVAPRRAPDPPLPSGPVPMEQNDQRNLLLALVLCFGLFMVYNMLVLEPQAKARQAAQKLAQDNAITQQAARNVRQQ